MASTIYFTDGLKVQVTEEAAEVRERLADVIRSTGGLAELSKLGEGNTILVQPSAIAYIESDPRTETASS